MSRRTGALLLAALCLLAGPAAAWGPRGHHTSAVLAERLIAGSRAERETRALLAPLGTDLAGASVWADCVKAVRREGGAWVYTEPGRHPECRAFETPAGRARAQAFVEAQRAACRAGGEACHRQFHYTDVAVQRPAYSRSAVGTSDHDLVAALQACIAVLQGRPAPPPFVLHDPAEALLLLVHLVGDVHQPLHVASVYLDAEGRPIDPDQAGHGRDNDTVGGNRLRQGEDNLHHLWDELPPALGPAAVDARWLAEARVLPRSHLALTDWPRAWADDTLAEGRSVLGGLRFGPAGETPRQWPVLGPDDAAAREARQRRQITRAGARLAQLLQALWP